MNEPDGVTPVTRSGFVGLAGRPNVGKSTLVNQMVGATVAISSFRPQTTRRAIRGVWTSPDSAGQLVLVDLPGVQKPRDSLTSRMQRRVEIELADADVALLVINAEEGVGPGDRFIASAMLTAAGDTPVVCAVNKADVVGRAIVPVLQQASGLKGVSEVFPISALTGDGVPELRSHLLSLMPEGPLLYPAGEVSDQSKELLLAELIRSQVLIRTRDEVPHSAEVRVESIHRREDGLLTVSAEILVESRSQKGILIGKGGKRIGEIGTGARKLIERELGERVHLDLVVRHRGKWRRDEDMLDRLGIE
jgi:GTP-binding protein Era